METLILILFVSTLTFQQTLGQDVEIRGTNDKVDGGGGGQTRTIYSQRHLSPHRMMHFGKRPMNIQPPIILTPQVLDLYKGSLTAQTGIQASPASHLRPDYYPYLFSIELENGQTLSAVPEDLTASIIQQQLQVPNKQNYYTTSFDRQPEYVYHANGDSQPNLRQQQSQFQQQALGEQKFLKLLQGSFKNNEQNSNTGDSTNNDVNEGRSQPSSNSVQQEGNDQASQQSQAPDQAISLSTRSMQSARSNTLNLPKAYISSLLYGKQSSSALPNIGSYNKKAEPKGNFFMHFGRK